MKERGEGGGEGGMAVERGQGRWSGRAARGGRPREGHKGGVGGRQQEHLKTSMPARLTVRPFHTGGEGRRGWERGGCCLGTDR